MAMSVEPAGQEISGGGRCLPPGEMYWLVVGEVAGSDGSGMP
jgi:hypothetical protein